MIDIVTSSTGDPVVRFQGKLLASRFDPRMEAKSWLARRSLFVDKIEGVFVLGLGSGYHVLELQRATSGRIMVIEPNPDIIAAAKSIHTFDSARVMIECVTSARELRASENVKKLLMKSFTVLQHAPSVALSPKLHKACATQLMGRDWGSLSWQWQLREGYSLETNPRVESAVGAPLTIYDLEQTELVQNSEERERLLIKALRELVK
ncbi:MAG: hypothetical protein AB7G93_17680 [Bdellovibrionales bacterium]